MNLVIGDTAGSDFSCPAPVVTPDGERLLMTITDRGACHLAAVPTGGGEIEILLGGPVTVLGFGLGPDGGGGVAWTSTMTISSIGRVMPASL